MVSYISNTNIKYSPITTHSQGIPLTMEKNELALSNHEDIIDSASVIGQSNTGNLYLETGCLLEQV